MFCEAKHRLLLKLRIFQIPFQQERTEVGQYSDIICNTDIAVTAFDSCRNIRISYFFSSEKSLKYERISLNAI